MTSKVKWLPPIFLIYVKISHFIEQFEKCDAPNEKYNLRSGI